MYFPFLTLYGWGKRSAVQPQAIYCESSAFTVKIKLSASTSPLAGQPVLMHKNTHASSSFISGGAVCGMGIYSEFP